MVLPKLSQASVLVTALVKDSCFLCGLASCGKMDHAWLEGLYKPAYLLWHMTQRLTRKRPIYFLPLIEREGTQRNFSVPHKDFPLWGKAEFAFLLKYLRS